MAFGYKTIDSFGGAVGDIFGGILKKQELGLKAEGARVEGKNYRDASRLAEQNAEFTRESTGIKEMMADRQIYHAIGRLESDITGAGFDATSGSGLDILRDSASQGAIQKQLIGQQGLITEASYHQQQVSFERLAEYSEYAAGQMDEMGGKAEKYGWITGGIKAFAGIMSLFG